MEHARCPNCGRNLTEDELYCYFCEMELEKMRKSKKITIKIRKINSNKNKK